MATITWKVNSSGNWSTATDWGLGRIPAAGDAVVINTASPITVTYDSAAPSVAVNSLTVGADNFDVAGGNTLSITSSASFGGLLEVDQGILNFNTVNASIASFDQTGGTISGTGTLTVSGAATFDFGNSFEEETGTGTTLLQGTTTYSYGYIGLDGGRVLENAGTFNVSLTAAYYFTLGYNPYETAVGGGTIKNDSGATFDFQSASAITNGAGTNTFVNAGTLEQTVTTGTTDIGVALTNTGAVSVQTGTLEFDGGGTSTAGAFTVASGATLDFNGGTFTLAGDSFSGAGVEQVSGGTVNLTGTVTGLGALNVSGGTLSVANAAAAASLSQTYGTIAGTGTLTVSGAATFSGEQLRYRRQTRERRSSRERRQTPPTMSSSTGGACWRTRARSM